MEYESNDFARKEALEILVKTARIQTQMGGEDSQAVNMESMNLEVRQRQQEIAGVQTT